MDRRERMNDLQVALQAALDGLQARMWTSLPAKVQSFDAAKVTVVAQATVQPQVRQADGTWKSVTLPVCSDCPVLFPSGGGLYLTFPIAAGDEGLLVFASRCIDAWWQNGDVQPQATTRMHDLSDGFFIPGAFSNPRALSPAVNTGGAEIRNADRSTRIRLASNGAVVIAATNGITLQGSILLSGNVQISGSVTAVGGGHVVFTGDINATGNVRAAAGTGNQVTLQTHTHPGNNQPPTPGT